MAKHDWAAGDVAQIDPKNKTNTMFAGCFLVVTEVKSWGVQGYVKALGFNGKPGGQAHIRLPWDEIEYIGRSVWMAE